jgi:hypothetical protein
MSSNQRTTPPPCRDIQSIFPEFRSLGRTTVRLHPRRGVITDKGASKLGGDFLWPCEEAWPKCGKHEIPYVGVIQLRHAAVPELGYRSGTDLFQLLWCPRDHEDGIPAFQVYWRNAASIHQPLLDTPRPLLKEEDTAWDGGKYIPEACRLHPERVVEFPDFDELPARLQHLISTWDLSNDANMAQRLERYRRGDSNPAKHLYSFELGVASGTKVGGYCSWIQFPCMPTCRCGKSMAHLFTISPYEPLFDPRWGPIEDVEEAGVVPTGNAFLAAQCVTGMEFGDGGKIYYFICRSCPEWPITAECQCG